MTYFGFLALFVGIPLALLFGITWWDKHRGVELPPMLSFTAPGVSLGLLVVIAVLYTTPWDNYLVATKVWWYDPNLVTGLVLGWVPIEEYTFFVAQPLLTGLWLLLLARRLPPPGAFRPNPRLRWTSTLVVAILWFVSVGILIAGWQPGIYLGLELSWALLPVMLQLIFGADILWRYRRLVVWTIIPTTLYLSAADAIAIQSGTWTIDPAQSLNIFLFGQLPIEEFVFFLLTNTLVGFGLTLILARESASRLRTKTFNNLQRSEKL